MSSSLCVHDSYLILCDEVPVKLPEVEVIEE